MKFESSITRRCEFINREDIFDISRFIYTKKAFKRQITEIEQSKKSAVISEWQILYGMLDAIKIEYKTNQDIEYYKKLINQSEDILYDEDINDAALCLIYKRWKNEDFPSSRDYLERIVNQAEKDDWQNDTLRVRLLKQILKYGYTALCDRFFHYSGRNQIRKEINKKYNRNFKNKDICENEFIELVDDSIFNLLDEKLNPELKNKSLKEIKERRRKNYEILKDIDDLTSEHFRGNGATIKLIYLLGICYGLTYSSCNAEIEYDIKKDFRKNFFEDFYNCNLVNSIIGDENWKSKYVMPSGRGINYKNYAEVVMLYFINKDDLTPNEKIEGINRVASDIEKSKKSNNKVKELRTNTAIDMIDECLNANEEELKNKILENYEVSVSGGRSKFNLSSEQHTAAKEYRRYIERYIENRDYIEVNSLWFTDIFDKSGAEREDGILKKLEKKSTYGITVDRCSVVEFIDFFEIVNEMVLKNIDFSNPEHIDFTMVNRITVLSAVYHSVMHKSYDHEEFTPLEIYNEFKIEADELLKACYYQPVSEKNIFDFILLISICISVYY